MTQLPKEPAEVEITIDDRALALAFRAVLSSRASDLLDIACAAYRADRIHPRRPNGRSRDPYQRRWSRSLTVEVAVREPDFWRATSTCHSLARLLCWLTEDDWTFEFDRRVEPLRAAEAEGFLFDDRPDDSGVVALFSGGLDSYAGATRLLDAAPARPLVLVAATTNARAAATQRRLALAMRTLAPNLRMLPIRVHLRRARGMPQEQTQRSRPFLFFALAAAACDASGLRCIVINENGVGAMNLPYLFGQAGAHTSNAAHPRTIQLVGDLLSAVFGEHIEISEPLLLETKAEVVRKMPERWRQFVPLTASCDSAFTNRQPGSHLCGTCTSCLLRRQALLAAGLAGLDGRDAYRFDCLTAGAGDPRLRELGYMLEQVSALKQALARSDADDAWAALIADRFVELTEIRDVLVSQGAARRSAEGALMSLFSRYVDEWEEFPSPLVPRFLESGDDSLTAALWPSVAR